MSEYGIDVSNYNAIASWPAIRGVPNAWAWCKATQGGGYTNPKFASQFTGAAAAGLAAGAYHFPDPNVSVVANISHFVAIAGAVGAFATGAFVPMLDIENDPVDGITWTAASANAFIPAFRDQLRAATGQPKLCVYAPQSWWADGMLRPDDWADQDVFLCAARYGFSPGNVGWLHPRLAVHQYTNGSPQYGTTLYSTDRSVTVGGYTASDLIIGATGKDEEMSDPFYCQTEQLDEKGQKTGAVLKGLYSGGYLSGLGAGDIAVWDAKVAAGKTECTWITWQQWQDWDGKGNKQLIISQQLLVAQQQTNDVLAKTLAAIQAMPAGNGGVDLAAVEAAAKDGGSAGAAAAIAGTTITFNPPKN